jgi:ApeA N-terminal domain 1
MALSQLEPFEIKGEWWRSDGRTLLGAFEADPGARSVAAEQSLAITQAEGHRRSGADAGHACAGHLRLDPDRGLRLSLLGASSAVFGDDGEDIVIHGRTTHGRPCTLLGCLVVEHTTTVPAGFAAFEIVVHQLIHGAFVEDASGLRFDRAVITLPGLREFLAAGARDPGGGHTPGLGREGSEEREARIDGATLAFWIGWLSSRTFDTRTETREARVEIALERPVDLETWREDWLRPLVRLISFASREGIRPATFTALIDPEDDESDPDRPRRPQEVEIVAPQKALAREPRLVPERMLLTWAALGPDPEAVLGRWFSLHRELGGAADFLFGSLAEPLPLEPRLITMASVAEAYHRVFHDSPVVEPGLHERSVEKMVGAVDDEDLAAHYRRRLRFAGEPSQNERILAVVRRAGDAIGPLGRKSGRLANAVTDARNYFVHLPAEEESDEENPRLFEMSQLLTLAVLANLLLDLGLPTPQIEIQIAQSYAREPFWDRLRARDCAWPKARKNTT